MHEFGIPETPSDDELMMDVRLSALVMDVYLQPVESEEQ